MGFMIENVPVVDEQFSIMNEMIEEESIPIEKSSTVEQPINALVLILFINHYGIVFSHSLKTFFNISFLDHLNHRRDQENDVSYVLPVLMNEMIEDKPILPIDDEKTSTIDQDP
jgi:hypothetical protein